MSDTAVKFVPLLGEVKAMFVDGEIRDMIWNGEKWLRYRDVYPLIHYATTGTPVNWGDSTGIR